MGQRGLLFVVIAALAVGSCVADYESNGKNLSWIYDIKNSQTTQNQTYRLNTDTGAFRYHFDISAVDSYKFETNSNDAVTMGCYGWKDLTNKWHGTNYVADSHGRRDVRDINKPVVVFPSENEQTTRLFLDHLPQCLAFALDTPPLMVYVFTNHPPTKPPPVVFEPHDHVPHSSEVVHKVHEGVVPPKPAEGIPTVTLAKTSRTGSRKVPQTGARVTGEGLVKVPQTGSLPKLPQVGIDVNVGGSTKGSLTGSDVTGGKGSEVTVGGSTKGSLTVSEVTGGILPQGPLPGSQGTVGGSTRGPLTGSDVTGAGPLTLTIDSSSPSPSTHEQDLIAEVTSVVPILSTQRTVKGRQDLHGLSTKRPRPVIPSGSGEDLTEAKINLSVIPTGSESTVAPTSVPSGSTISIQSVGERTPQPGSTYRPSFASTGGDLSKASPTAAGDVQISLKEGNDLDGTVSTVGVSQGTPTGASLLERGSTIAIGTSLGERTPVLGKSPSPATTTAAPIDSEDPMDIFNPSKWDLAKKLKTMVSAVLTAGQKLLGISKDSTSTTALGPDPGVTPSPTTFKQTIIGPVTTLYKVDIPTLSKTGQTTIGSKLVSLPSTGPLSQVTQSSNEPNGPGRPTNEGPTGFKITVEETKQGPDSIINIGVSPPDSEDLPNFVSTKTTASPSPAPVADARIPAASTLKPTGRPFEETVSQLVTTPSRRPDTPPASPTIPSASIPIGVTVPQRIVLPGGVTTTSPQFVQTASTGFPQGPTISTIGEFITSRPSGLTSPQGVIGLLAPSSTPSTFITRHDFSTRSDRPLEYGPSSLGPSTATYLPPTTEGPACSCVCPSLG